MTDAFTPAELAEDATFNLQEQLKRATILCSQLQTDYTVLLAKYNTLANSKAAEGSALSVLDALISKRLGELLSSEVFSYNVDTMVSKQLEALSAKVEFEDKIANLVLSRIDQMFSMQVFESEICNRIRDYVENMGVECEAREVVEKAVEEALSDVRITFR